MENKIKNENIGPGSRNCGRCVRNAEVMSSAGFRPENNACASCSGCAASRGSDWAPGCGSAAGCSTAPGCGAVILSPLEVKLLSRFAELAFLPAACPSGEDTPYCPDLPGSAADNTATLLSLRAKGLITIDPELPLQGCSYRGCETFARKGSMALTARGQAAAETLEITGAASETR